MPKISFNFSLLFILVNLVIVGCGDQESKLKHASDKPVRNVHAWNWIKLSKQDFFEKVINWGGSERRAIPDEYKRLQTASEEWVDRIDAELRSRYPRKMLSVPKPGVLVVNDSSPNAFVSSAFTCYDVSLLLDPLKEKNMTGVYLGLRSGGNIEKWPQELNCVEGEKRDLLAALDNFNAVSNDCKFKFDGLTVKSNSHCKHKLSDIARAKKIVIPRTANWITIHSGLFTAMDTEESFVAIIAHELGHYYRSHGTSFEGDYDFFYKIKDQNGLHKPLEDKSLESLGEKVVLAANILNNSPQSIVDQKISSYLYFAAGTYAKNECTNRHCLSSCRLLADLEKDKAFQKQMAFFPFGKVKGAASYYQYERLVESCLSTIKFDSSQQFDQTILFTSLLKPTWVPFLDKLSAASQKKVFGMISKMTRNIPYIQNQSKNVYELFHYLSERMTHKRKLSNDLLSHARQLRLGQYTAEQEADEVSIEWLSLIGVDPRAGIETFLKLASLSQKSSLGIHLVEQAQCRRLYRRNWKNVAGDRVFIPVGDYSENHHSLCYRAFNLSREIESHRYTLESTVQTQPEKWASLQALSKKLLQLPALPRVERSLSVSAKELLDSNNSAWEDCPLHPEHKS